MTEIISVSELRKTLKDIDNCEEKKHFDYADGTSEDAPCSVESMCDKCIEKFMGLLQWAVEDIEEAETILPPNCS